MSNKEPVNTNADKQMITSLDTKKTKNSYVGIQAAGVIFVVVVTVLLIFNIMISGSLKSDSSAINLAGRQRMLSQRITKALNLVKESSAMGKDKETAQYQAELKTAYNQFNDTLTAFAQGGKTIGASGDPVPLKKAPDGELQKHVTDAAALWTADKLDTSLLTIATAEPSELDAAKLASVSQMMSERNNTLLKLMNNLTVGLDNNAQAKSSQLGYILMGALILVFANFAYIVIYAVGTLKKRDGKLRAYSEELEENFSALQVTNEKLTLTQDELNESNDSLKDALGSVKTISEQAQSRADDLEELTLDLNRLKEESDTIFNSVDHGLCLIDKNSKIGNRISRATYDIFEKENLSGQSFTDLMRPLITEKDHRTLESYLKLQFQKKTLKSQLEKYNPLKKIDITLDFDGDNFSNKQLGFEFERIMNDDEIEAVLVTITDVTETIALENELKKAGEDQERKTKLILEIIQSDRHELELFLAQTTKALDSINGRLREHGVDSQNSVTKQELIEDVFRSVHNIKGNASMLGLGSVVDIAHSVEDSLSGLRGKNEVKGEEFLTSLVKLATLRERLNDYEEVTDTLLRDFSASRSVSPKQSVGTPSDKLSSDLSKFVHEVAKDEGKKVYTRCKLDVDNMSVNGYQSVKGIMIQAVRNSVVHGVESPEKRLSVGKLEEGIVSVVCHKQEASDNILGEPAYEFIFHDDGAGLDIPAIREKAVANGIRTKSEVASMKDSDVASLIFEKAFSTLDEVSEHGGRGTGVDVIKDEVINTLNGKISMSFVPGVYMKFSCIIPAASLEESTNQAIA